MKKDGIYDGDLRWQLSILDMSLFVSGWSFVYSLLLHIYIDDCFMIQPVSWCRKTSVPPIHMLNTKKFVGKSFLIIACIRTLMR